MTLEVKIRLMKAELLFGIKMLKQLCKCGIEIQRVGKHARAIREDVDYGRVQALPQKHYATCRLEYDDI